MLGLALLYFIGKQYYELADDYDKSKWGYAILGVVSYYIGTFIGGILIAIAYELWSSISIEQENSFIFNLIVLPFGILSCVALYQILKKNWEKNKTVEEDIIDEIGRLP
ncbi:MAG: hypothetical protein R3D00_05575 [Bacteroidia bacterium]